MQRALEVAVLLNELQPLLWPDAPNPRIVVRTDEDGQIDELLPRMQSVAIQHLGQLDQFDADVPVLLRSGHLSPPGDVQVPHQPGRAEQQRVEILRRRRPRLAGGCHVSGLCLTLLRRLHDRYAEKGKQDAGRLDNLVGHAGRLRRLASGLLDVPLADGVLPFLMSARPPLGTLGQGMRFELVRNAVEHIHGPDVRL